jgi:hypothetical protein
MKNLKLWEPIYVENSKLPVWLSKLAPIEIWAISFGFCVWCRGTLTDEVKRHEAIHFQQQLELLMVFQWILYGLFWLVGYIKYRDGSKAYAFNPFEREAFGLDQNPEALAQRKRYGWIKYKI